MNYALIQNRTVFVQFFEHLFFMPDYNSLELSDLYDQLAAHTVKYTKMLAIGATNQVEFVHTKELIDEIQLEIEKRNLREDTQSDGYVDGLTPAIA